jgi:methyl-accepting chemotaxis protein
MKNKPNNRGLGKLLIFIATIGIIFSIFGITTTWYYRPRIRDTVFGIIDSFDQILANTSDGLTIIDSTLDASTGNLQIIISTLDNLKGTFDNISVSLGSSADLIGGDLRETIIDTQIALNSAAQSAGLIDNTLRFIASIPLLGADYRPEVPLSTSLEQVSESMNDIPEAFLEIEQYIRETEGSMDDLQTDVSELSGDIQEFEKALIDAQIVFSEYGLIFEDMREQLLIIKAQTATFLWVTSILVTGGFFLLGVAQVNIYHQGKTMRDGERVTLNLSELKRE